MVPNSSQYMHVRFYVGEKIEGSGFAEGVKPEGLERCRSDGGDVL